MRLNLQKPYCLLFLCSLLLSACTTPTAPTKNQGVDKHRIDIPFAPLSSWSERKFSGSSQYRIQEQANHTILTAKSQQSASLLFKKIHVDLNQTPYLNWEWQVKQVYADSLVEQQKQGDDFPARIYIAIKPKLGQIKPRALTYVWASNAEQFSHWKNPFSNIVEVFALQSGARLVGQWQTEKRNLKADLSRFFGQNIDAIEGIGVMTDGDNSKSSGEAAYANLYFSRD